MSDTSTTPAKRASSATAADKPRPYETMMEQLRSRGSLDGTSAFDVAARTVDKIAEASDWDAIVGANESGVDPIEDYIGQPLNATELAFPRSQEKFRENSLGAYVVITAFTDDGTDHVLTTGAPNVVASLYRAEGLGLVSVDKPLRFKIRGKDTSNGTLYLIAKA